MKRKLIVHMLLCAIAVSLSACGQAAETMPESKPASVEAAESLESVEVSDNSVFADQILTKEQMLADYDSMWAVMKENYPFWGVIDRMHRKKGEDYTNIIENYRGQIEDMDQEGHQAMWRYIEIISSSLYDVCGATGHTSILNPRYFREFDATNKKYLEEMPILQAWVDIGNSREVNNFYEYYDYLLTLLPKPEEKSAEPAEDTAELAESSAAEENLIMKIMPGTSDTAYIKVNSFDDQFMETDLPKIRDFLEQVKDYDHLIIDISENGGGNTEYWELGFVRPNISEPVTYRLVRMMKDTEMTRRFYGGEYEDSVLSAQDVKTDPQFSSLPEADSGDLTLARELSTTLEPETGEKLFQGKIWVLTGPSVYSSSEAFAVFCKETGFATLVGQTTGGSDSGGAIWYELPNSHVLIMFDVEYCLNSDGSCNMETGTSPDIEAEDALKTVMELIEKDS